jgi:hypothetical protein
MYMCVVSIYVCVYRCMMFSSSSSFLRLPTLTRQETYHVSNISTRWGWRGGGGAKEKEEEEGWGEEEGKEEEEEEKTEQICARGTGKQG